MACTGIIYGNVTSAGGSPVSNVQMRLKLITREGAGPLEIAGNDSLSTYVPVCESTKAGEYVIPFYWGGDQVPTDMSEATVQAIRWHDKDHGSYNVINKHGLMGIGVDVLKLIAAVASPIPSNFSGAANQFLKFYLVATPELKGLGNFRKLIASAKYNSAEIRVAYCNVDFVF